MSKQISTQITRPVEVVYGYNNIATALRTSVQKVRGIIELGAPIVMDDGRPKAEKAELWGWYKEHLCGGGENPVK